MLKKISNWVRKIFTGKPRDTITNLNNYPKSTETTTITNDIKPIAKVEECIVGWKSSENDTSTKEKDYNEQIKESEKELKEEKDLAETEYIFKESNTFLKFFEFYTQREDPKSIIPPEKLFTKTHFTVIADYINKTQNISPKYRTVVIDNEASNAFDATFTNLRLSYDQKCNIQKAFINSRYEYSSVPVIRKYVSYNYNGINHINIDMSYLGTEIAAKLLEVEMVKLLQYQVRGRKYFSRHCWFAEGQANLIIAKATNTDAVAKNHNIPKRELCAEGVFRRSIDKHGYQKVTEQCVYYTKNVENWQIIDYKPKK